MTVLLPSLHILDAPKPATGSIQEVSQLIGVHVR